MNYSSEREIPPPKKYGDFKFTFNERAGHSYESRLERISLSKGKYRKALYPIMQEVRKNKFCAGTYGFVFNDFKVVADYNDKGRQLHTITFLTRQMRRENFKVKFERRISQWYK